MKFLFFYTFKIVTVLLSQDWGVLLAEGGDGGDWGDGGYWGDGGDGSYRVKENQANKCKTRLIDAGHPFAIAALPAKMGGEMGNL